MSDESRRVALVTGAAGGLGMGIVEELARQGWSVAAGWHRREPARIEGDVFAVPLDVTDVGSVQGAIDGVLERWGRIDLLVNNAGIVSDALLARMEDPMWDRVLDVNLDGAFRCARAVVRPMMRQRDGQILNITSYGGRVGRAGQANYAASKAALFGFTQSLARELGSRNIRVNAVSPGFLRTGLVADLTDDQLAAHAATNTLGRLNDVTEVARFVAFLAGMRNVSGQLFQLDSRITPWT
ncbi:MAG: 3-oxoacyl-[acyl-carrier-protein] reductase [Verrucomicrobiota bacterium]|jgi:3-oxoacyl-[acyl-carrier protein] reductase